MTDSNQPLRLVLLEALQAVAGDCEALRSIGGAPRGKGNLADIAQDAGGWALTWLRDFWQHWDVAQDLLDHIPADALQALQNLAGRPWKLATRQTLDDIAKPIQATRPWFDGNPDPTMQADERRAMLTAWETADFSTWPALLADLAKLAANLWTIRSERYAAPGADPRGGGAVETQQPQDLQAGPVGDGQGAAAGGGKRKRGRNINGMMLDVLQRGQNEARGWTARQWAAHLNCSVSSIHGTPTWKDLSAARKLAAAERALSKHRRSKGRRRTEQD